MDKSLLDEIVNVKRIEDMIIMVKVSLGRMTMNIFSTYAPQVGLGEEIREILGGPRGTHKNDTKKRESDYRR